MITLEQLAFALGAPMSMVASGVIATFHRPSAWVRGAILHLAAGIVFAVVAVELIPDLLRAHLPIETVIGFVAGVVAMLGIRSLTSEKEEEEGEERKSLPPAEAAAKLPMGMLAGIAVDLLVDGLMMGIGFAAGAKEGRLLAMSLAVELVSLGLALSSSLSKLGIARGRSIALMAGVAVVFVIGATGGVLLLSKLSSHWLAMVLAFGAAALLFLVTEELLTEAHEEKETPALTAMFFAGFLLFFILGMVT